MKKQRFIGKYCDLVNNHYEIALRLSEIEVSETVNEDTDKKFSVLKEELAQTESQLGEMSEDLDVDDLDYVLRTLLR